MNYENFILIDFASITVIALVLGLALHAYLRRRNPHLGFGMHGNVWTQPFDHVDLMVVGFLTVLMSSMVFFGMEPTGAVPDKDNGITVGGAWFGVVFYIFILTSLLFFVGFLGRRNLVEMFGLARLRPVKIAGVSAVAMLATLPLVFAVSIAYQTYVLGDTVEGLDMQEPVKIFLENTDFHMRFVLMLSACLVAPVAEEFLFRGYLYPVIKKFSDRFFAAVATSALFSVIHVNVLALAPLFVLAMCFTVAYELTGCLWVPIVMHAIFNTVNVLILLSGGVS